MTKTLFKKISITLVLILVGLFFMFYVIGHYPKEDKPINKYIYNNKNSFVMNVKNLSLTKDVKTSSKNLMIEGEIEKGELKLGDTVKIVNQKGETFTNKVSYIRDKSDNQKKKFLKGSDLQVAIDGYKGENDIVCLIK